MGLLYEDQQLKIAIKFSSKTQCTKKKSSFCSGSLDLLCFIQFLIFDYAQIYSGILIYFLISLPSSQFLKINSLQMSGAPTRSTLMSLTGRDCDINFFQYSKKQIFLWKKYLHSKD